MPSDADPDVAAELSLCWGAAQLKLPACTLAFADGGEATGAAVPPEVVPPLDEEEVAPVVVVPEAELEVEFDG
jgi:hypothetical protein